GAGAPTGIVHPRLGRYIRESTVAIVVPELVGAEVGEIEIHPPVVVVVAGGRSHAVARGPDAARLGHVDEARHGTLSFGTDQVVPEQPAPPRRSRIGRAWLERVSLHHEGVEIAIAVIVEQGRSAAHDLGHVVLARLPGPVGEGETPVSGAVDEEVGRRRLIGGKDTRDGKDGKDDEGTHPRAVYNAAEHSLSIAAARNRRTISPAGSTFSMPATLLPACR